MKELEAKLRRQKEMKEMRAREAAAAAAAEAESEGEELADEEEGKLDSEGEEELVFDTSRPDTVGRIVGGIERHGEVLVELLDFEDAAIVLKEARDMAKRFSQTHKGSANEEEDWRHIQPPSPEAYPDGCPAILCGLPRGRQAPEDTPIIGDYVHVVWTCGNGEAQAAVVGVLPRRTTLLRRNPSIPKKPQPLCANLDLAVLVISVEPNFSEGMVDRVTVSAHSQGVQVAIALNKADLVPEGSEPRWEVEERLRRYERIGYPVIYTSALSGEGLPELRQLLAGRTSILIGNSGVGKSHLLNALSEGQIQLRVGEISQRLRLGKHTTTTSTLHRLPGEGEEALLIDSPGARRFSIWDVEASELKHHFVEFLPYKKQCRFGNCNHLKEPDCGVRAAVDADLIPRERYESYALIFDTLSAGLEGDHKKAKWQKFSVPELSE